MLSTGLISSHAVYVAHFTLRHHNSSRRTASRRCDLPELWTRVTLQLRQSTRIVYGTWIAPPIESLHFSTPAGDCRLIFANFGATILRPRLLKWSESETHGFPVRHIPKNNYTIRRYGAKSISQVLAKLENSPHTFGRFRHTIAAYTVFCEIRVKNTVNFDGVNSLVYCLFRMYFEWCTKFR